MLGHKETAAHVRKRIKAAKIKANVRILTVCGQRYVQVYSPSSDGRFSSEEIGAICVIAQVSHLTSARGAMIDEIHQRQLTGKQVWDFEYHGGINVAR